ncbi:hypothetical protein RB595_002050 [Gaeumannomyces hyphopodioides]
MSQFHPRKHQIHTDHIHWRQVHTAMIDWMYYDRERLDESHDFSALHCLGKHSPEKSLTELVLENDFDWKQCFDIPVFGEGAVDMQGYWLLLAPRAAAKPGLPARLFELPMPASYWETIAAALKPNGLQNVLTASSTRFSVLSDGDRHHTNAKSWVNDSDCFGFASTHHRGLSVGVVFGCTPADAAVARRFLKSSPATHPAVLPAVYAEICRQRLYKFVRKCLRISSNAVRALEAEAATGSIHADLTSNVRSNRFNAMFFEHEMRKAKNQLSKIADPGPFRARFDEIDAEYDSLITDCAIYRDDMSFSIDVVRAALAITEARASGRESKVHTVLAFVAMLYLPMTAVATIFSMPIFAFQNDWRDLRFAAAPDTGPVVSGYFWVFLAVALTATLLTIEGWWRFTGRQSHWSVQLAMKLLKGGGRHVTASWSQ